ncbi:MAG: ABC transporter substrate-binding protein [Dehalococcoidia bacterium]
MKPNFKIRGLSLWIAFLVALSVIAAACAEEAPTPTPTTTPIPTSAPTPSPSPTPSLFPLVLTDSNGKEVILEEPPERIIAFDSAAVEILFAIGESHRIVGTHSFVTYPLEVADIPKVGDAFNMNFEKIAELEPDLVYVFFDRFLPDLEALGVKVLYIQTLGQSLDEVVEQIRLWGRITNNAGAAEEAIRAFEARIRAVEEGVAAVREGPRVFHDVGDLWTPGPDTLIGRIYSLLKAENIAEEISGFQQFSAEVIVEKDPQVIITLEDGREEFLNNPAFQGVAAVKDGKVFALPGDFLSVAGPRLAEQMEELAELLYPDIFGG